MVDLNAHSFSLSRLQSELSSTILSNSKIQSPPSGSYKRLSLQPFALQPLSSSYHRHLALLPTKTREIRESLHLFAADRSKTPAADHGARR